MSLDKPYVPKGLHTLTRSDTIKGTNPRLAILTFLDVNIHIIQHRFKHHVPHNPATLTLPLLVPCPDLLRDAEATSLLTIAPLTCA